jgi:hypothetical protein
MQQQQLWLVAAGKLIPHARKVSKVFIDTATGVACHQCCHELDST